MIWGVNLFVLLGKVGKSFKIWFVILCLLRLRLDLVRGLSKLIIVDMRVCC